MTIVEFIKFILELYFNQIYLHCLIYDMLV
jgi:hypothetical protein